MIRWIGFVASAVWILGCGGESAGIRLVVACEQLDEVDIVAVVVVGLEPGTSSPPGDDEVRDGTHCLSAPSDLPAYIGVWPGTRYADFALVRVEAWGEGPDRLLVVEDQLAFPSGEWVDHEIVLTASCLDCAAHCAPAEDEPCLEEPRSGDVFDASFVPPCEGL